jgi:hypothetical protein
MCLIALLAWLSPRLAVFVLWLFDRSRMSNAFGSFWVALLGFLFLPWTTLAWAVCYEVPRGVRGFGWFLVILAFVVDLASYGTGGRAQRARARA